MCKLQDEMEVLKAQLLMQDEKHIEDVALLKKQHSDELQRYKVLLQNAKLASTSVIILYISYCLESRSTKFSALCKEGNISVLISAKRRTAGEVRRIWGRTKRKSRFSGITPNFQSFLRFRSFRIFSIVFIILLLLTLTLDLEFQLSCQNFSIFTVKFL